jgi:hypothetical protein
MENLMLTIFIISAAKWVLDFIPTKKLRRVYAGGISFSSTNAAILVLSAWTISLPLAIVLICATGVNLIIWTIANAD